MAWAQVGMAVISALGSSQRIKTSGAASGGEALSGQAYFDGENEVMLGKPMIDLRNPASVAIACAVAVAAVYVFKKFIR